jgi:hypothetical protein
VHGHLEDGHCNVAVLLVGLPEGADRIVEVPQGMVAGFAGRLDPLGERAAEVLSKRGQQRLLGVEVGVEGADALSITRRAASLMAVVVRSALPDRDAVAWTTSLLMPEFESEFRF